MKKIRKTNLSQNGELTNKDNFILTYIKKGEQYEFLVYKPFTTTMDGNERTSHICPNVDGAVLMTYNQFINYLYAELYIEEVDFLNLQEL
jgi:hypothetical protein